MLTPAEQERLNLLLGGSSTTAPIIGTEAAPLETNMSYAGKTAANFFPGAANKAIGALNGILNLGASEQTKNIAAEVPDFYKLAAPQNLTQHIIGGAGEMAEYLPTILATEGMGVAGLGAAGLGARAAKIGGSALGFALPFSPEGAESMAMQGVAGAAQSAATELGMGVRGRLAMGLIAGGIGYHEGAKTSTTAGIVQGGLNLLGPTLIDPALKHIIGTKNAATVAGKEAEKVPLPNQPRGPIPFDVSPDMPKDVAGLQLLPPGTPKTNGGIPFYEVPPGVPGTLEREGLTAIPGQRAPIDAPLRMPTPMAAVEPNLFGMSPEVAYGRGVDPFDAFAGVQRPSVHPIDPLMPGPVTAEGAYGRATTPFDAFHGVERQPGVGPMDFLSPSERELKTGLGTREVAPLQPVESAPILPSEPPVIKKGGRPSKPPHEKLPSGLVKMIGDDPNWVDPLAPMQKVTDNAHALGAKAKTEADVKRIRKGEALYREAQIKAKNAGDSDAAILYGARAQYFDEAAQWAEGNPAKAAEMASSYPGYEPPVPGAAWKEHQASGLKHPRPVAGETDVVYNSEGFPTPVNVVRVDGDNIHFEQFNFDTGQYENKVYHISEFDKAKSSPDAPQAQIKQEANPSEPVEPAPAKPEVATLQPSVDMVRVRGRHGLEDAQIVAREGDTLHVEIQDPIFGPRRTSVLAADALPYKVESGHTPADRSVPFAEIESAKLTGREGVRGVAQKGENEADLLGSVMEGAGPTRVRKTLPGREKTVLSVLEGLKKLPAEAATLIGEILQRLQVATKQEIDLVLAQKMQGAKGGMYESSGKVALNLQWINGLVHNWEKMSQESRDKAIMRVGMLFGHEATHVAQHFGERSNLLIDGKPLLEAIVEKVESLSLKQRFYVAEQIHRAKGDPSTSLRYLAGDFDYIKKRYEEMRGPLSDQKVRELAAGEFMAEIGAIELTKRMEVTGLPTSLREAIDKLKGVIVRLVDWFRGVDSTSGVAAMQDLSTIASKMYDHYAASDTAALHKAFPASEKWHVPAAPSPFSTGHLPPTVPPTPPVTVVSGPFLKGELARLGVRATVGGAAGGIIAPKMSDNQISVAEGILLGGVLGSFGPGVAKMLLSKQLPEEIAAAAKLHKNPVKAFAHIMGNGKSLRDLGLEGRFGWQGDGTFSAKAVRFLETHFNVNLDPKLKALVEEGRGAGQVILATVQNALEKARWFEPNASLQKATEEYFLGKISKDQFKALLGGEVDQQYGNFIITAREATTTLSRMFASGMPPGTFTKHVIDSAEQYLGRFYKAYKKGEFDMAHFEAAKKDMMSRIKDMSDIDADNIMREHMREVQANRSIFGGRRGNSGQKVDASLTFRRLATEEEIEAQRIIVGGLEHNPHGADFAREHAKLAWMEAHPISDNWRAWLGEYTNPVDRMLMSFQKIYPSAISAKIYDMLDNRVGSTGLKFAMTANELRQTRELLLHTLSKETDPAKVASLQHDIKELSGYVPLPAGSAYGKLQNKFVDRFVRDEISTYATPFKWMEQPILRGIANVNNLIKLERTALNPLTTIRNYLQAPLFGLIAKTNTGDVMAAWKEIRHTRGADYELMLKRHIIGADYVAAELTSNPGAIFSGYLDRDIAMKVLKHGVDKAVEFYQHPDTMIRAGSFISARKRFAQKLAEETGMSFEQALGHETVIDKAVEFTNRYTMNYATVPRIIKAGRQLPFVSLFISYTSEITRILNNLRQDAISPHIDSAGRMHAITTLGAMAAIPAMLTATFEGNLSPKDREDWEKVKALSPSYNRSRFRLPTYRDARGNFHYMDMTNLLPADSYSQMMKAFANGDMEGALAANPILSLQNTPLLNIAVEQVSGKDLRTDKDIKGVRGRISEILKETVPPWLPPGYEGQRLERAFSPNAEGTLGTVNLKTGAEVRPSDIIANYMTGMRFGNVNLTTLQKGATAQAQQQLADVKKEFQDVMRTNLSEQAKGLAQARYHRLQQEILLALHSKLDLKAQPATSK